MFWVWAFTHRLFPKVRYYQHFYHWLRSRFCCRQRHELFPTDVAHHWLPSSIDNLTQIWKWGWLNDKLQNFQRIVHKLQFHKAYRMTSSSGEETQRHVQNNCYWNHYANVCRISQVSIATKTIFQHIGHLSRHWHSHHKCIHKTVVRRSYLYNDTPITSVLYWNRVQTEYRGP